MLNLGRPGRKHYILIAITFSALSLEAFANVIGDKMIPSWKDKERRLSIPEKLKLACEHLNVHFDGENTKPWATAFWLASIRRDIVHARPEPIRISKKIPVQACNRYRDGDFPSQLERQLTIGNAQRAVDDTYKMMMLVRNATPDEVLADIAADGWLVKIEYNKTGEQCPPGYREPAAGFSQPEG